MSGRAWVILVVLVLASACNHSASKPGLSDLVPNPADTTPPVDTAPPVSLVSITVSPGSAAIPAGRTQAFTASASYSDGHTQDVSDSAAWAIDPPYTSATFAGAHEVKGVAPGAVSIIAQVGFTTGSAALTVTAPVAETMTLLSL